MASRVVRAALLAICLGAGALSGPGFTSEPFGPLAGGAAGLVLFALSHGLERLIRTASPPTVIGAGVGALCGLLAAVWLKSALALDQLPLSISFGAAAVCTYLGATAGGRGARSWRTGGAGVSSSTRPAILDTSAIIDGRIADLVESGFVGGPLVVPQFVLTELQGIADSTDPLKRARGRRGLGILERMQGLDGAEVRIVDQDVPRVKEVDGKIVALAKAGAATVVTNDFNLTKVAELQGVRVLNIHQLSHALRPVFLPGEELTLTLQKQGKEPGQGVGYLDDGTMVVVDGGASRLGESIRASVTSVLQTTAGRMIFAKPNGEVVPSATMERKSVWRRRS